MVAMIELELVCGVEWSVIDKLMQSCVAHDSHSTANFLMNAKYERGGYCLG